MSDAELGTCTNAVKSSRSRPFVRDAGIKFTELMSINSPRVPFCKQLDISYAVSGVIRMEGVSQWNPEAIKATKTAWDKEGIKRIVVEGPMSQDHVPVMATEIEAGMRDGYTTFGMLYAIGHMHCLAEAIAKEGTRI
jgi:hypothetical protein